MRTVPERGRITDAVVAYLTGYLVEPHFALLVGDGDPPNEAGWTGNPGTSNFVPSTTVRTGQASKLHNEALRSRHTSWRCRYGLRTLAGLRKHADDAADAVRQAMAAWESEDIAGWKLQDVVYETLAGVEAKGTEGRDRYYEVDDVVDLWIVRAVT